MPKSAATAVAAPALHSAQFLRIKALASNGVVAAQHRLGFMYFNGDGVARNLELALHWYQRAAYSGLDIAQYNLGVIYQRGQGVPQDDQLAVHWYTLAAEQGYPAALVAHGAR